MNTDEKIIFHIDVNSAYLSWSAAYALLKGAKTDLRDTACVVGGDELSRHGIVLAKSLKAKACGIRTGEPLAKARRLCPDLIVVRPDYRLYMKCSNALLDMLRAYFPKVEQFSVDECFLEYADINNEFESPVEAAHSIRKKIKKELGFTVNIGISTNKLLAKMASDFEKPDRVHTLFKHEIPYKMWPLPVEDLFMCGSKTTRKLRQMSILTIEQLAKTDIDVLYHHFKSFGFMLHNYANGIDDDNVKNDYHRLVKSIGNSTTSPFDITTFDDAKLVLLSLCESVAMRLRKDKLYSSLISVSLMTSEFKHFGHQRKIHVTTNSTTYLHLVSMELFKELWDGSTPIRKLGVKAAELTSHTYLQGNIFNSFDFEKHKRIDEVIDFLRAKFGSHCIYRSSFLHSSLAPIRGGIVGDEYPVMKNIL